MKENKSPTAHVIEHVMELVSKDVLLPKCIRDGLIKPKDVCQEAMESTLKDVRDPDIVYPEKPYLIPYKFRDTPEFKGTIEYGKYLVILKNGKNQTIIFNGSGWSTNHNEVEWFYLPKLK